MTIAAGVGLGCDQDSFRAGQGAAAAALTELADIADLMIVFTTDNYQQREVLYGIRSVAETSPIIGCCAGGLITRLGLSTTGVAVMALRAGGMEISLAVAQSVSAAPYQAGKEVARALMEQRPKPRASPQRAGVIVLLDGITNTAAADTIRAMSNSLGVLCPLVGGGAGDSLQFRKSYQFLNDGVYSDALVAALIRTRSPGDKSGNPLGVGIAHGFKPVGRPLVVTRSEPDVIYELDGQPAFDVYQQAWRDVAPGLGAAGLSEFAVTRPLGLPQIAGHYLLRDLLQANPDGSIRCVSFVPENAVVHLMTGDTESLLAAARVAAERAVSQLGGRPPAAAVIFDCVSRLPVLGDYVSMEIESIRDVIGREIPLIGFYTLGEIAPPPDSLLATFHNKCIVVCILAASG